MRKYQRVDDVADEVLARQARGRARRTGEPLEAVLKTKAGRRLEEPRAERKNRWQEGLALERQRRGGRTG